MQPDYTIKTIYCFEDLKGISRALYKMSKINRSPEHKKEMINIVIATIVLSFIITAIFSFIVSSTTRGEEIIPSYIPPIIFFIAIGIFSFLFSPNQSAKKRAKLIWKVYPLKGQQIVYLFYQDKFYLTEPNAESKLEYSVIQSICEDSDCFYLFNSMKNAYVIPKRELNDEVQGFRDYMKMVTGLGIIDVDTNVTIQPCHS